MKLKLDENIGIRGVELLRQVGHDVSTVKEQELCSAEDSLLIDICKQEDRCLVTLDHDFANPIVFEPRSYCGIVVLRLPSNPGPEDLLDAIRTLTAGLAQAEVKGKLWVVRKKRIREYNPDQ